MKSIWSRAGGPWIRVLAPDQLFPCVKDIVLILQSSSVIVSQVNLPNTHLAPVRTRQLTIHLYTSLHLILRCCRRVISSADGGFLPLFVPTMSVLDFLCDIRFHKSYVLPPNLDTGRRTPYRVSYADYGDPGSNAIVLFCGALMGCRFCYSPLDQLAKAYKRENNPPGQAWNWRQSNCGLGQAHTDLAWFVIVGKYCSHAPC